MTGSLDNIYDALDKLQAENCVYVLVVGRPDEAVTRAWCNLLNNGDEHTKNHLASVAVHAIKTYEE